MAYTHMEMAQMFIRTGELTDALNALNDLLELRPHDEDGLRLRAAVLSRLGGPHFEQALHDLQALPHPSVDDWVQISIIYERQGQLLQATQAMQTALEQQPMAERLAERWLQLHIKQADYAGALTVIQAQPPSWRWHQWAGDVYALMGDYQQATERYGIALAQAEAYSLRTYPHFRAIRARLLAACGAAFLRLRQPQEALQHYEQAQHLLGRDASLAFYVGLAHAQLGHMAQAQAYCESALKRVTSDTIQAEMRQELERPEFAELREALNG